MPIPKPETGETQDEFISRCMHEIGGEYDEQQALAICFNTWRGERSESRAGMPHLAVLKSRGSWQHQILADEDLFDWFRNHIDSKGVVREPILLFEKADIKPVDGGYLWTMSDFSVDRDNERVDPLGWNLDFYRKLPVVLWSHEHMRPAIGVAQDVKSDASALTGRIRFSSKEVDEFAAMIEGKVKEGIIKAGSVGFLSNKIELLDEEGNPTKLIHRKQTLLEFSVCNIPTNINAMMQPALEIARSENAGRYEILENEFRGGSAESYIARLLKQEGRETSDLKKLLQG